METCTYSEEQGVFNNMHATFLSSPTRFQIYCDISAKKREETNISSSLLRKKIPIELMREEVEAMSEVKSLNVLVVPIGPAV